MSEPLKPGDRVKVKNLDNSCPNLEYTIDEIKEINNSFIAEGPYGGFNIELLELVPQELVVVALKLSQEEYEQIESLAACNYAPSQIATYLSCNKKEFLKQFHTPDSLVHKHYYKGVLTASFEVDNNLLENAKTGNITAAQEIKKAQEKRLFENHKNRILNEG